MRITARGQITIPQDIRERLGLLPHTEVEFVVEGRSVRIVKRGTPGRNRRGQAAVRRLRGTSTATMSTAEIMALTRGED